MGQNAVFAAKVKEFSRGKGGKMIHPVNFFLLAAVLFITIQYKRDPRQRAAFLAVLRDQKAMTLGLLWVIFALGTRLASQGFHDILNTVLQALLGGSVVAAIVNWYSKRKRRSETS